MPETIPKETLLPTPRPESAHGAEPTPVADRLFELVARIRRPRPMQVPRDDDRDEQHRQRHGQMRMLVALGHSGPLTVQDLARVLEVSAPTASVVAKKAFEEGLVERRKDANDSRVVWLDLAEAGRDRLRTHRQHPSSGTDAAIRPTHRIASSSRTRRDRACRGGPVAALRPRPPTLRTACRG
jgi:DNA-binding MarR family transcriptional regulator